MSRPSVPLIPELDTSACDACGTVGQWNISKGPHARKRSTTAVAACAHCGKAVFLKRVIKSNATPALEAAEQAYSAMDDIHRHFPSHPKLAVIQPYWRNGVLLACEQLDGEPPEKLLRSGDLKEATAMMALMAQWFANFHRTSGERQGPVDLSVKLSQMQELEQRFTSAPRELIRAVDHLRSGIDSFPMEMPLRRLHSDAKPENFLETKTHLVGIDIGGQFWNPAEFDLAQFLAQFELAMSNLLGNIDDQRRTTLIQGFLGAYQEMQPINPRLVYWMNLYFVLGLWRNWRSANPLGPLRWDRVFKRRVNMILRDAEALL